MQFYISVMFVGLPDDIHDEKPSFLQFKKKRVTDPPTDGRTDRRTDRPSYRDSRTHLKSERFSKSKIQLNETERLNFSNYLTT